MGPLREITLLLFGLWVSGLVGNVSIGANGVIFHGGMGNITGVREAGGIEYGVSFFPWTFNGFSIGMEGCVGYAIDHGKGCVFVMVGRSYFIVEGYD